MNIQEKKESIRAEYNSIEKVKVKTEDRFTFDDPKLLPKPFQTLSVLKTPHALVPTRNEDFIMPAGLFCRYMVQMSMRQCLMLTGLKGSGKTATPAQIYAGLGQGMLSFNCGPSVEVEDLLGAPTYDGNSVVDMHGIMLYCFTQGIPLVLEEISGLSEGVLLSVSDILERGDTFTMKNRGFKPGMPSTSLLDEGYTFIRHPGFQLWATDNTGGKIDGDAALVGRSLIDAPIRSRFAMFQHAYVSSDVEKAILLKVAKNNPHWASVSSANMEKAIISVIEAIVSVAGESRELTKNGAMYEPISMRETIKWVNATLAYLLLQTPANGKYLLSEASDLAFVDSVYSAYCEHDREQLNSCWLSAYQCNIPLPNEYSGIVI